LVGGECADEVAHLRRAAGGFLPDGVVGAGLGAPVLTATLRAIGAKHDDLDVIAGRGGIFRPGGEPTAEGSENDQPKGP